MLAVMDPVWGCRGLAPLLPACKPWRSIREQREKGRSKGGCDSIYLENRFGRVLNGYVLFSYMEFY